MKLEELKTPLVPGKIFNHKNGVDYVVLGLPNSCASLDRKDEYPTHVLYCPLQEPAGKVYTKTVEEFLKSRTETGFTLPTALLRGLHLSAFGLPL